MSTLLRRIFGVRYPLPARSNSRAFDEGDDAWAMSLPSVVDNLMTDELTMFVEALLTRIQSNDVKRR